MTAFLVDEDLPRTLAGTLRRAGLDAEDVRDNRLGGKPDSDVIAFAVAQRRTLITRDVGIADITRFPLGSRSGVVLVRFPQAIKTHRLNAAIRAALGALPPQSLVGTIVVIEPGRVRVRRRLK